MLVDYWYYRHNPYLQWQMPIHVLINFTKKTWTPWKMSVCWHWRPFFKLWFDWKYAQLCHIRVIWNVTPSFRINIPENECSYWLRYPFPIPNRKYFRLRNIAVLVLIPFLPNQASHITCSPPPPPPDRYTCMYVCRFRCVRFGLWPGGGGGTLGNRSLHSPVTSQPKTIGHFTA